MNRPLVKIHLLPGGRMPERQTEGAIGYDVRIRAVVSHDLMEPDNPKLRKTLFDFATYPDDPTIASHLTDIPASEGGSKLGYRLRPGESVLVGIGFATEMPFPLFYDIRPRSGLATKYGIVVVNVLAPIDPDYRGEAGVLIYNPVQNKEDFILKRGMRIAQIVFLLAMIPEISEAVSYDELGETVRGVGGFGSTGLK